MEAERPERASIEELTLRIPERANRLAQQRGMSPGCELALWLEAEAEVKRELRTSRAQDAEAAA